MFRLTFLTIVLLVSTASSTSMMKKSLARRQSDNQPCQAIQGFDCKCSYYRATCTTDQDLPSQLSVLPDEQHKYQSVELVISAPRDISVNAYTFEPVKQLYKLDGNNLEFRVKFEKFTALHLTSPGIFNGVFPENLPANARKHIALEIYNPEIQPHDNVNLFQNINVESLELYALYPFRGSFQQLFNGANINYLRLSGGDIRSDATQSFSGNVARLELAKQASALSVQNFPVYPAHELIINAFYISEFNNPHPPNYNNLVELRVHSLGAIPANAFQNFPNIHALSLSSDQGVDPQALNGLNNLEKLTIKDTKVNLDLLKSLPNLKEFETNIDKLDDKTQCQLVEKLANGQLAVQAIPNGRECTCVSAYLDTAAGRPACDAQHCDHSSCAAIKNNYDPNTRTFKAPPAILRADGSNALQQRPSRVYQAPFQISQQDQQKLQQGIPQVQQPAEDTNQGQHQPQDTYDDPNAHYDSSHVQPSENHDHNNQEQPATPPPSQPSTDQDEFDYDRSNSNPQPAPSHTLPEYPSAPSNPQNDDESFDYDNTDTPILTTLPPLEPPHHPDLHTTTVSTNTFIDDQNQDNNQGSVDENQGTGGEEENPSDDGEESKPDSNASLEPPYYPDEKENDGNATDTSDTSDTGGTSTPGKKRGMSWLPIIIIAAAIALLLLIGLIVLLLRKKNASKAGYNPAATNEGTAGTTTRA